jgi:predicted AlkP superfamily phosphohydrolase/phosphomutase
MNLDRRVLVIGLDSMPPETLFEAYREELPVLRGLMESGATAKLRTVLPPITVPAWTCMMSGRDPGELGIYGFRNRANFGYDKLAVVTADSVASPRVWDFLGERGLPSIVSSVPPAYPVRKIKGSWISCFLTPSTATEWAYPESLQGRILRLVGPYPFDAEFHRTGDKAGVLGQIRDMTVKHFTVFSHLLQTEPWTFAMHVEIGVDRLHHAFWRYFDPKHKKYGQDRRFEGCILDYYKLLDEKIGQLLAHVGPETIVLVVSDHGTQRMDGLFCINEWLIQRGYLILRTPPSKVIPVERADIDWSRTRVWAEGGYYARLFLNQKGREPRGIVEPAHADALLEQIASALREEDPQAQTVAPREIYREVKGVPPDRLVFFGEHRLRAAASVGHGRLWLEENDTGPDDANHSLDGILVARGISSLKGDLGTVPITSVAGTILKQFGIDSGLASLG